MSYLGVGPDQQVPLYRTEFTSAEQTITPAGLLTIAHGLGVKPSDMRCYAVCKTSEHNWAVGDEVEIVNTQQSTSIQNSGGVALSSDATNISIRFGSNTSTISVLDKTTGVGWGMTNANWKIVVRAWAEPAPTLPEVFTKEYTAEINPINNTVGSQLLGSHGLGGMPKKLSHHFECLTADAGYAVGDIISDLQEIHTSSAFGWQIRSSSTQIWAVRGNSASNIIIHATTGVSTTATNASWKLVVRAWR